MDILNHIFFTGEILDVIERQGVIRIVEIYSIAFTVLPLYEHIPCICPAIKYILIITTTVFNHYFSLLTFLLQRHSNNHQYELMQMPLSLWIVMVLDLKYHQ
jgi:hypothetical protein